MIPNSDKRTIKRRPTSQRELVLEAVREGNHPSAREIFERLRGSAAMSFGTVYRNLQILAAEGEIACVEADPNAGRYDRRRDRHHHLYCRGCGRVFDVPIPYREDIDREAAEQSGFLIESHTTAFQGLCAECARNETP